MIVVALPQVARDFGVDVAATSWIVTSYLIAMASLQPIAGKIGDHFGRKRVMLGALVYFALASVGAAVAPSILALAVFRLNQAIAAAALVPNGLGLLREALPPGRRGAEFGIVSAASGVGATVGPLVGGLLAAIDWRFIFLVNVPVCATAFVTAWRVLPARAPRVTARFDLAGAVGLGVLLLAAAWVLVSLGHALDPVIVAIGLAIGLIPLAVSAAALPLELLVATLGLAGVGLAFTFPAMRLAAVEAVEERHAALASGVFSTSRYFGGMLGSIAVAIALAGAPTASEPRVLFGVLAGAAFAAAIPSLALPGEGMSSATPVAEEAVG